MSPNAVRRHLKEKNGSTYERKARSLCWACALRRFDFALPHFQRKLMKRRSSCLRSRRSKSARSTRRSGTTSRTSTRRCSRGEAAAVEQSSFSRLQASCWRPTDGSSRRQLLHGRGKQLSFERGICDNTPCVLSRRRQPARKLCACCCHGRRQRLCSLCRKGMVLTRHKSFATRRQLSMSRHFQIARISVTVPL